MKLKYGIKLGLSKVIYYTFRTKADRNQALRKIREGLRLAGLTRADFFLIEDEGFRKGRGMRVLKGGKRR